MDYRVDLDIYNGPLDLLLYLIRKEEVEITDIPVVRIAEQYIAYMDLLQSLDINVAGEFLVMAATLMEIKSRMILPRPEMEIDDEAYEPEEDPRLELVQQLLEYKRFRDAADDLTSLGDEQSRRYSRPAAQIVVGPDDQRFAVDEMMKDVELWDLLNAFAKVMKSISLSSSEVVYDDTPIEEVGEQIIAVIRQRKSMLFTELFLAVFGDYEQVNRTHLITAFLAILECIRQRLLGIEQDRGVEDLRLYWREESEQDDLDVEKQTPPTEAMITSREAAREADGFARPEGRMKDEEFDTESLLATEFDADLDAIVVPEVTRHKRVYTDDELMGRPEAEDETTPDTAPENADEPDETPPADAAETAPDAADADNTERP
jgi:segregation and condensation protein A